MCSYPQIKIAGQVIASEINISKSYAVLRTSLRLPGLFQTERLKNGSLQVAVVSMTLLTT